MSRPTIVVGIDGSTGSRAALRWGHALATEIGGTVQAVMVWHYPYVSTMPGLVALVPDEREMHATTRDSLDHIIAEEVSEPIAHVDRRVIHGDAASALVDASVHADLVVVGRNSHGPDRVGSVARHLLADADAPVALIDEHVGAWARHGSPLVMVATDGSPNALDALRWTITTLPGRAAIAAVRAHDEPILDDLAVGPSVADRLDARAGIALAHDVAEAVRSTEPCPPHVERIVLAGDPRTTIIEAARNADVLVVGSAAHTGLSGMMLGSFVTHAAKHTPTGTAVIVHRRSSDTDRFENEAIAAEVGA